MQKMHVINIDLKPSDKKLIPNWIKQYEKDEFKKVTADDNTLKHLSSLGIKTETQQSLFLNMYKEHKKLAIKIASTKPELFKLDNTVDVPINNNITIINQTTSNIKVLKVHKQKTPNWVNMFLADKFEKTANKNTLDKLGNLGMNDKNIKSFLHMYKEDKNLAIWTINNKSSIFEINKPKDFTLRKIEIKTTNQKKNDPNR